MDSIISHNIEETAAFAKSLAPALRAGAVLALCGELGAGKTHFTKGLAEGLGCDPQEVTSPTFTLVHEYTGGRLPLYHFDFYRLESEDAVIQIGLDDYLDSGGVLAIEWADKFASLLPHSTRVFRFRTLPDGTREISETPAL